MGPNDYLKIPERDKSMASPCRTCPGLKQVGISGLWLPPAAKAIVGGNSVGYDVYDLWIWRV